MNTTDHPYVETNAARMLAQAIGKKQAEGTSLRTLAPRLGYKQATVLSHMATGRVPIPIDRAMDLAKEMGLPERDFLMACLAQRHPEVDWSVLSGDQDDFGQELAVLAGQSLDSLPPEHRWVMMEVVADPHPSRRWLKIAELSAIELLRDVRPNLPAEGLPASDRRAIRQALSSAC